jgi:hypothetical protein
MTDLWQDPEDAQLARTIFGEVDRQAVEAMVLDWAAGQGFGGARLASIEISVGAAATLELADGSKIVVKTWSGDTAAPGLSAQLQVQAAMSKQGFPAPAVLAPLSPLGPGHAAAMSHERGGEPTDARIPAVRRHMAQGLALLLREADACRAIAGLPRRELPPEGVIWPKPHNSLFDFAKTAEGAEWIDDIAESALATMRKAGDRVVVGHNDWSAKNMRMGPQGIAVVYDWDAIFLDRETFILGSAVAHFQVTWELPVPETPTAEAMAAFLRDYEQARGADLTAFELEEVAAAATYARAYNARCEHAIDPVGARWRGSSRENLRSNGPYTADALRS